jgi:hypothetical protein
VKESRRPGYRLVIVGEITYDRRFEIHPNADAYSTFTDPTDPTGRHDERRSSPSSPSRRISLRRDHLWHQGQRQA